MHGKHLTYNKVEQQGTNLALLFLSNFWIMLECWIHAGRGILAECCGLVESPPIQVLEWAEEERIYRICIAETCPCITCFFTENERTPMYCSCIVVYCSPCPSWNPGLHHFISGCDTGSAARPNWWSSLGALCWADLVVGDSKGWKLRNLIPLVQAMGHVQEDWLLKRHKCKNSICM